MCHLGMSNSQTMSVCPVVGLITILDLSFYLSFFVSVVSDMFFCKYKDTYFAVRQMLP